MGDDGSQFILGVTLIFIGVALFGFVVAACYTFFKRPKKLLREKQEKFYL